MCITGWTEGEINDADGNLCDWFLAFDDLKQQLDRRDAAQVRKALRLD